MRGVDTRVRPARTPKCDWFADNLSDRRLETTLHRRLIKLALPAVEIRAVIGNGQANVPGSCPVIHAQLEESA